MRNPARIKSVLCYLQEIWEEHPDLRFGQLITAILDGDMKFDTQECALFYLEEYEWLDLMDKFVANMRE